MYACTGSKVSSLLSVTLLAEHRAKGRARREPASLVVYHFREEAEPLGVRLRLEHPLEGQPAAGGGA